eukprot:13016463-Alexandrium_andersonii.AAC.1
MGSSCFSAHSRTAPTAAEQERPGLALPQAVALGLRLKVEPLVRVGPHPVCLLYTSPSPRD